MDLLVKIAEYKFFSSLWAIIFLIPALAVFHYCMYHTNKTYKASKLISEWSAILLFFTILIGITFYYS